MMNPRMLRAISEGLKCRAGKQTNKAILILNVNSLKKQVIEETNTLFLYKNSKLLFLLPNTRFFTVI